ncbi:MAG: PstS family phosphate ABC transporter substrate-binding protein [Candidatus Thorarchaeota archaeon]|nr:PstS family phosphate ABC transporter substrate-binding protein [Candidatus Thorarchaeota archaeon]
MDSKTLIVGLVIGLLIGAGGIFIAAPALFPSTTPTYTITSSGSTTVLPLSQMWASEIGDFYPNFVFNPTGGGSGKGQADAASGLVDIGASSSYPKEDWRTANPNVDILPISADALGIVVNDAVNGSTMYMDADQACAIFARNITTWEAFETTFGVSVEATGDINVYVRSDASGTTATFAKWLKTAADYDHPDADYTWGYGDSESIDWAAGINAVEGNPGVASGVESDANAIGYVGLAFMDDVTAVWLYNPSLDEYIEPTVENALNALPDVITNPGVNLFNADRPNAYPIARLIFYLIPENPQWYTIAFLSWCLSAGQTYILDVGYVPIAGSSAGSYAVSVIATMVPA